MTYRSVAGGAAECLGSAWGGYAGVGLDRRLRHHRLLPHRRRAQAVVDRPGLEVRRGGHPVGAPCTSSSGVNEH